MKHYQKFDFLSLFVDTLNADQKAWLDSVTQEDFYTKGQEILKEGDINDHVFLILSGHVESTQTNENGKMSYYGVKGPGMLLGEYAAFNNIGVSGTATAINDVHSLKIHKDDFLELLFFDKKYAFSYIQYLSTQLNLEVMRQHKLTSMEAKEKLLDFLDMNADDNGVVHMPKRENLAAFLGIKPETLSRMTRKLYEEGICKKISPQEILLKQ